MSPPGIRPTPASGGTTSAATPEILLRDATRLMASCGILRAPSWIRRIVRDYLRSPIRGLLFGDYLAARLQLNAQQRRELEAQSELRYVLDYADPTGETAIRHVMAAQR